MQHVNESTGVGYIVCEGRKGGGERAVDNFVYCSFFASFFAVIRVSERRCSCFFMLVANSVFCVF